MKKLSTGRISLLILAILSLSVISLLPISLEQQSFTITTNHNDTNSINGRVSDNSALKENITKLVIPQPDLDINTVKPWHGMLLESDQVRMNLKVTNHLNSTHTYSSFFDSIGFFIFFMYASHVFNKL